MVGKTLEQLGDVFGEGDVSVELQSGRGIRQKTSDEGSQGSITGKTFVAEPLDIREGMDSASSTTNSTGAISISDPLLTLTKTMTLVEIPLDDGEESSARNPQATELSGMN
jgi:hypothetical protein